MITKLVRILVLSTFSFSFAGFPARTVAAEQQRTLPSNTINLLEGSLQENGLPDGWTTAADNFECTVKFQDGAIYFERLLRDEKCSFFFYKNLSNGDYLLKTKFKIDGNEPQIFLDGKPLNQKNKIKVIDGKLRVGIQTRGAGKVWGTISSMILSPNRKSEGLGAESTASASEAPNWCEQVKLNLADKAGEPIDCSTVTSKRCVKMNNYWCQKHSSDPWKGTPRSDGSDGHQDIDGHAIFKSGEWSARAIAIDLRSKYYKGGKKTAVEIAAAHSPWCDTLGSKAIVQGHGRTCLDGRARPPRDFSGPFCRQSTNAAPTRADCQAGCNCPPEIAETLVKGLNLGINDDLQLFDSHGRPGPNLGIVMKNLAFQEQSIHVVDSVILDGIKKLGN